ncbi:peptidoglycan-binding protein [Lutispora thermophila]|uniref:Spore cortex-lytic enzyme n=1 Tax=Lutispora thermophila DSM 19022 TaxID=1122184 RepID=A0A1M6CFH2_9FIRM|nr:peptidoglycan-binding protein [Lutispora thermophila]SHI59448.1 spore cortex-lytic enzyme [Lutispora thermophila DSM 19022]
MKTILKKVSVYATVAGCIAILTMGVNADTLIKTGSRGSEVYTIQTKLKNWSYTNANPDGIFGNNTKEAVKYFQRKNGLTPDGVVGYLTLSKLGMANVNSTLKSGSRGDAVKKLQSALNNKGYSVGIADGVFGSKTYNAVVAFQKANGLTPDGIAGPITQTKLYLSTTTTTAATTASTAASRGTTSREQMATDLYWLSRIINAEAEAEPYKGKVAVGNVIMNRVNSSYFPNTIKGVIFEYYQGIPQFSPVADGTIYNEPNAESIAAAKEALNGSRPVGNSTYFFNPAKSAGTWIVKNKTYVTKIGNHVFYK